MSSGFHSVQHCNLWCLRGIFYGHNGLHNLPVNDVVLVTSVLLDIRHGLIHTENDIDIGSVGIALIYDHHIHGEHFTNVACLDGGFHIEYSEIGCPQAKFHNLLICVAVRPVVVREAVLVLIQCARIIPDLCLIVVPTGLRRAVL